MSTYKVIHFKLNGITQRMIVGQYRFLKEEGDGHVTSDQFLTGDYCFSSGSENYVFQWHDYRKDWVRLDEDNTTVIKKAFAGRHTLEYDEAADTTNKSVLDTEQVKAEKLQVFLNKLDELKIEAPSRLVEIEIEQMQQYKVVFVNRKSKTP